MRFEDILSTFLKCKVACDAVEIRVCVVAIAVRIECAKKKIKKKPKNAKKNDTHKIRKRALEPMCKEVPGYCKSILYAILYRFLGLFMFIIGLAICLPLSIVGMIIMFVLSLLTLFRIKAFVMPFYFCLISFIFTIGAIKSGIVMIIFPKAGLLGLAEVVFELSFTNLFAAKFLTWLDVKDGDFDLNEFVSMVYNFIFFMFFFAFFFFAILRFYFFCFYDIFFFWH